jgi:hypothetical protein
MARRVEAAITKDDCRTRAIDLGGVTSLEESVTGVTIDISVSCWLESTSLFPRGEVGIIIIPVMLVMVGMMTLGGVSQLTKLCDPNTDEWEDTVPADTESLSHPTALCSVETSETRRVGKRAGLGLGISKVGKAGEGSVFLIEGLSAVFMVE